MKKNNNNLKYALIKMVAVISVFQASALFNFDKKENNLASSNSFNIEKFVNNVMSNSKGNSILASTQIVSDDYAVVNFDNAKCSLKIINGKVLINTTYIDGFIERKILDIDSYISTNSFISNHYEVANYNTLSISSLYYDFEGNINNLGKEKVIMDCFKISQEELDFVLAGPMAEGIEDNYRDVSAAMRTGINRFFSYAWVWHAVNNLNLECDYNEVSIYDIFRDPWQFAVYYPVNGKEPRYQQFLGVKSGDGYQGALDTLYYAILGDNLIPDYLLDRIVVHDYLEFQDKDDPIPGSYKYEQFVEGGNKHYRHQKEADRIPIENSGISDYINKEDENTLSLNK